jgi:putative heme transporter
MTSTAPTGDGALGAPTLGATDHVLTGPRSEPPSHGRVRVPAGVEVAAAWAWRGLLLAAALYVAGLLIATLSLVILPVVIALMVAALLMPVVNLLMRLHVPRPLAALFSLAGAVAGVFLLLTLAGQQIVHGAGDLADQVVAGLDMIRVWLRTGPLDASEAQINSVIESAQEAVASSSDQVVATLSMVTTAVGHVLAGGFIVLFATYFFLADGSRIWAWTVRLFPRTARARVDSSGRIAWMSLTAFVRATILIALVDSAGVLLVAAVLQLPFLFAIGVLVFLGAFVPIVGALLSGLVAVMVALVDQGPVAAAVMLVGVVAVQQIEAHVLQPFLLGRLVAVHPLGVVLAIAAGILVAGVVGALIAVPLVAVLNAVAVHLAAPPGDGTDEAAAPVTPGHGPPGAADAA